MANSSSISSGAVRHPHWMLTHLVLAITCAGLPFFLDASGLGFAVEVACYITLAMMWNLLAGYAGLMSIGQQLFVGIGGYTLFLLAGQAGLPIAAILPLAGVVAALVAAPTIWLCMRLQGPYFAIATWVLADAVMLFMAKLERFGGASGLSLPIAALRDFVSDPADRTRVFWAIAAILMLSATLIVHALLRSAPGLALTAVRDNQEGAESVGVDATRIKAAIFILAAAFTGVAGAVLFLQKLRISPAAGFDLGDFTATVIFIVVIGGIGQLEGAFVGAILYFVLRALFADLGSVYLMMLGGLAIAMMLFAPAGIWGLLTKRNGWSLFPTRRPFHPSQK